MYRDSYPFIVSPEAIGWPLPLDLQASIDVPQHYQPPPREESISSVLYSANGNYYNTVQHYIN